MSKSYELLKKLVEINTVNDNESEISLYLYDYLKKYAEKVELLGEDKRRNILAYFGDMNSKNILLFNGHLDTVSAMESDWKTNPFVLTKKDGMVYGRGTADMKGGIVASIFAILEAKEEKLIKDKLVIFAGSVDEETGANSKLGCKKVVEHLLNNQIVPTGVIIPEPNTNKDKIKVNLGHRGLIWILCESKGTVVHSGLLRKENNPVINMYQFIEKIYSLFPEEPSRINDIPSNSCRLTHIHSGFSNEFRKTPANCIANFDIRISPLEKNEDILNKIEEIANQLEIQITVIKNTPSSSISDSEKIVKIIEEVLKEKEIPYVLGYASPTCDAHWFINKGIPAINGMGVTGDNIHSSNEYIVLNSIYERINIYKKIIDKF